jgi:ribonuclease BN (tRNA processing enzyme)
VATGKEDAMKLTILGSGTVVPDGLRNSAGYFVEAGGARLMMDCGAGTVHALARFGLGWERMTHLYISHFHVDHVGELAAMFFAFKYGMRSERTEPLTVIGPRGLDRVMGGLKHSFGDKLFEPKFPVRLRMLAPGESVALAEGSRLAVAKTPHTEESLAVRVESEGRALCYTGDTDYGEELASFFSKADLLISECSFRERRDRIPHLSISDVARIASDAAVARLVVTHFYFDVDEPELTRQLQSGFSGEVIIGRDGLTIEI